MNIIIILKNNIRKYIRKYIAFACSLLFISIFSFNASASAITIDLSKLYDYGSSPINMKVYNVGSFDANGNYTGSGYAATKSSSGIAQSYLKFDNVSYGSVSAFEYFFQSPYNYPFLTDKYDYYFYSSMVYGLNSTYSVDRIYVRNKDGVSLIDDNSIQINNLSNEFTRSCSVLAKLDIVDNFNLDTFLVIDDDGGSTVTVNALFYVIPVPKGLSSESVQSIISAINNQTSSLGDKIDGTNDLIQNGDSDTQSVVSDFNEVFEDFNNELENIENFDNEIIGEFESANEQYLTELNNFSLSASLLNAGNWLSTSMQTVYDNSSDYKMLWLVPLLLGIPLIILFLKRSDDNE